MARTALARTELEALLRARNLDRTVTRADVPTQGVVSTGIASLDQVLGGGVPRGEMSEVVGARSSGRATLLCAMLASATADGGLAALVDAIDMFDPQSAAEAGIQLERLLWIRGDALSRHPACRTGLPRGSAGPAVHRLPGAERQAAADPWARALDRAVKALNLVLQAGGFDLVTLDLGEVPPDAIRRLPFTTWFRLQRTLEASRTACVLVAPAPIGRSAGGLTLQLNRPCEMPSLWAGQPRGARLFLGLDVEVRVVRSRDAATDTCRFTASTAGQR